MQHIREGFNHQRSVVIPQTVRAQLAAGEATRALYMTDIGYYPDAAGHYRSRRSGAAEYILIYCREGEGAVSIRGERHSVHRNQFFILAPGTPHIYEAAVRHPWTICWLHFTGEQARLFQDISGKVLSIPESPDARFDDRIRMFEEMLTNLELGYGKDILEYTSMCLWHFLASFKYISCFRAVNHQNVEEDLLLKTVSFMKSHLSGNLTLEEMAAHVNYSPSHFGQVFLKKSGNTPMNYFLQLKIQKSCQYLDFTSMKIKEIAFRLSFYDQYHFSRMFSRIMGESPSGYRRRSKG